jgi:hypothetical protein
MPLLLAAYPSFAEAWEEHRRDWDYEEAGLYNDLAQLAHHLVKLVGEQQTGELPELFGVVERLVVEGDDEVQEAATIGLLEDVQTLAGWARYQHEYRHSAVAPEAFAPYLGPESRVWWDRLHRFWAGEPEPE